MGNRCAAELEKGIEGDQGRRAMQGLMVRRPLTVVEEREGVGKREKGWE